MKLLLCFLFSFLLSQTKGVAQTKDEKAILAILDNQTKAWNSGDLDKFMVGYWESDSLMYIGKSGVTYGYKSTLASYKKNYGDTARMGKLTFTILHVNKIESQAYFVVGKWQLVRSAGNVGGHYTLLFRKIKGQWVIVADHSS